MSLICKLLGHTYQEGRTEQREIVEDGNALLVDYNVRECSRCGDETEEKIRTKIRNSDSSSEGETSQSETSQSESSTNFTSHSAPSEPKTSEAQGGIIIKQPDESDDESETESFTEQPDKEYVEEDGAVLYDQECDDQQVVSCDSCEYEELSSEPTRRTGDLCTECGGWLTVEGSDKSTEDDE